MFHLGDCPRLSKQELKLAIKDKNIEKVVRHYIPLTLAICKRFGYDNNVEDIRCVGLLALVEVVNRLDPENINDYDAFIGSWVKGKIRTFVYRKKPMVYFPNQFLEEQKSAMVPGRQTEVDIEELFEKIPENINEEIILKCIRERGYTLKDMVEACQERIKRPRVSQIKHKLLDRIFEGISK